MTSPTSVANIDALNMLKRDLIRKGLKGGILRGDVSMQKLDSLTVKDTDGKIKLRKLTAAPYNMKPVGALNENGIVQARSMDVSKITSWGVSAVQRTDVKSDTVSIAATRQETSLATLAEALGQSEARLQAAIDPETGELKVSKDVTTVLNRGAYIALSQDVWVPTGQPIFIGLFLPIGEIVKVGDVTDANADNARGSEITVEGRYSDEYDTDAIWFFGGQGWADALESMGFDPVAASTPAGGGTGGSTGGTTGGTSGGTGDLPGTGGGGPFVTFQAPVNGSTTADSTPTISGHGQPGAIVNLTYESVDAGVPAGTILNTVTADGTGYWETIPGVPLANGTYTVTATAATASSSVTFTITV